MIHVSAAGREIVNEKVNKDKRTITIITHLTHRFQTAASTVTFIVKFLSDLMF